MGESGGFAFLVWPLCLLGFGLLALAMPRHWKQVVGGDPLSPLRMRASRLAGFALLAASVVLCFMDEGAGFGSLMFSLVLAVSATVVALILTWSSHWFRPLARLLQFRR